ncbi:unnamed protein product [Allacma fusca]|uniref:Adenylate kinase n=1 Tax=Allacma fusca TaxID=39272 RepID=A0A8J2J4K9_9HEXA|nr:unnamed protein product [Allacma fusca]
MGVCMGKDNPYNGSPNILGTEGRFEQVNKGMNMESRTNNITFSEPRVPVIFILGGPGSGKITHCDRAVQERHGLAHVNMTDLIQQHIVGNGLSDFSQMPPKNLLEVLLIEMKMAVNASAYLISGYPRSMRDVVEYTEKLQRVDRVILLNWHVKILEKQIEFGAQLGDTVLQLARMELKNYNKNVLAVAEYYDQLGILSVVDGERQPTDVYIDFLQCIDNIMTQAKTNKQQNHNHHPNQPPQQTMASMKVNPSPGVLEVVPLGPLHIIWVIGGPGSNKSQLSSNSSPYFHLSIGNELRSVVSNGNSNFTEEQIKHIKDSVASGELVSTDIIMSLISQILGIQRRVVIDGFPRNAVQLKSFQDLTSTTPPCILVDCSEVELGRSIGQRTQRADDSSPAAIKKRLEIYRLTTLPTLKILDDQHRLFIVDGDGDRQQVTSEFNTLLHTVMQNVESGSSNSKAGNRRRASTDTLRAMYLEVDQQ